MGPGGQAGFAGPREGDREERCCGVRAEGLEKSSEAAGRKEVGEVGAHSGRGGPCERVRDGRPRCGTGGPQEHFRRGRPRSEAGPGQELEGNEPAGNEQPARIRHRRRDQRLPRGCPAGSDGEDPGAGAGPDRPDGPREPEPAGPPRGATGQAQLHHQPHRHAADALRAGVDRDRHRGLLELAGGGASGERQPREGFRVGGGQLLPCQAGA
mmetsp:Transcript_86578/g.225909  ORF Transcript_86578/g.225909 Transcript_86578/m.225909 type:complete len:211 (-) Transcript_86578:196-828(-)